MLTVSTEFKSAIKGLAAYSNAKFDIIQKTNEYALNNIVLNGDFVNGTTSWTSAAASISSTSGILSVLATNQYGRANQTISVSSGNKFYVASFSKADSSSIRLQVLNSTGTSNLGFKAHTGGNTYELLSTIITSIDTSIILNVGRDTRTSSWTTSYHDYVFVFDLTTIFGAGNEPTISSIDTFVNNFGRYFLNANYIDGARTSFDSDDIISMEYLGSAIDNDKVLGNLAQHSLTVKVHGDTVSGIDLTKINVIESYIGILVGSAYEYVKQQTFLITDIKFNDTNNQVTIIATDYLFKLNNEFIDANTYPMTLKAYLESVLTYCGLSLENSSFLNSTFSVDSQPFSDYTSCKEIVSRVAELSCSFGVINKTNDKFELRTAFELPSTVDETLTKDNYFNLKLSDNNFGTNGVNTLVLRISQVEGENTTIDNATNVAIDGAIEVVIEDNDFINTQTLRESVDDTIFAVIDGYKYQPYNVEYRGFPYIELGDIIQLTKMDDSTIKVPVFEWSLKWNGGLYGKLGGKALNKTQTSYKYISNDKNNVRGIEVKVDKVNADFTILAGKYNNGELVATGRYVFNGTGAYFYSDAFNLYDNSVVPVLKVYFDTVNSRYVFNGEIKADAGIIGGFTIGATKLTAGATNATSVGVASGETYAFWAGHLTASSAPFRVTRAGALTASSGVIGGWTVGSSTISKGAIKLDSTNERVYINTNAYLYSGAIDTAIYTNGSLYTTGGIIPNNTTGVYGLGTPTNYWGASYFDSVNPYANALGNLGALATRWATLYLNTLNLRFSSTNYTITRDTNGFLKAV